ncbi:MAG: hypothetical protein OXH94_01340 [Rhodospirillales bacterium]|nr:hypothetical protein [Rhodospirillales bacterium]
MTRASTLGGQRYTWMAGSGPGHDDLGVTMTAPSPRAFDLHFLPEEGLALD